MRRDRRHRRIRRFGEADEPRPTLVLVPRSTSNSASRSRHRGATWLDHRLVAREPACRCRGWLRHARCATAMQARMPSISPTRRAGRRQGQRIVLQRDLLATLRRRELDAVGARLSAETGLAHSEGRCRRSQVAGTYRQRLDLSSGRFAMIDDRMAASASSWCPGPARLERKLGQHVAGAVEGASGGGIEGAGSRPQALGSRLYGVFSSGCQGRKDRRHVRDQNPLGPDHHRLPDRAAHDLGRDPVGPPGGSASRRSSARPGSSWRAAVYYPPPAFFWWWYFYDAYAPADLHRRRNDRRRRAASSRDRRRHRHVGLAGPRGEDVETYGSARWATSAEVKAAGLLGPDGVVLGLGDDYLRHDGPEHVLCFAPTRSARVSASSCPRS
jgi:hypothetical protein